MAVDLWQNGSIASAPNQRNMGLGPLGTSGLIFKRKFRWTIEVHYCLGNLSEVNDGIVPPEFVKMGSRPQLDIEETEINYLNGKMWIPGKGTWQTLAVTWYDVAASGSSAQIPSAYAEGNVSGFNGINGLFGWLASVYDFTNPTTLYQGNNYFGEAKILLYDGCGNAIEGWLLQNVWPQSVNFGELDMSSSDECTIEVTLRYSNVSYQSYCPTGSIAKCPCTPCPTISTWNP